MRSAVVFLLACFCGVTALAQTPPPFAWVSHLSGTNFQHAGTVALSPAGNVYFTGHAGAGAVFGTNSWTSTNTLTSFLAKHDSAGRLLWVQRAGSVFLDSLSFAFDSTENLYLTGVFRERAEFGNLVLTGPTNGNATHVFLAKFAPDGNVPWAKVVIRADQEVNPRLTLERTGDVYLALGHAPSDRDEPSVIIDRYDAFGNRIWPASRVISSPDGARLHDIKVDHAGNAYVSGNLERAALDTADYFLTQFDPTGERSWTLTATGTDADDFRSELAIDQAGFAYIAGEFRNQTVWGTNILNEPTGMGVFLTKVNPAGQVLWARNFPGTLTDLDQDAEGNLYLAGDFVATITLGTNSLVSRGSSDFFLARFDRDGTALWIRQGGGTGWDHSPAVSLNGKGNVFLTGFFVGTINFGPVILTSRGMTDLFIAKYNRQGKILWAGRIGGSDYEYPGSSSENPDNDWAVDAAGNIYFPAVFWGTTVVGTRSLSSAGNTDVFFAKLSADPPETLRLLPLTLQPNAARIQLIGAQGRAPIHIEASSDLKTWTSIYTQALPSDITITDPLSNSTAKFYRAVIP